MWYELYSYSTQRLWLTLLETTRKLARDHGILGELYGGQISNRLTELTDDIQRIYKKVGCMIDCLLFIYLGPFIAGLSDICIRAGLYCFDEGG